MLRALVPVDGAEDSLNALRRVVNEFRNNPALEIHLLNVQVPFSQYIARFVSGRDLYDFYCDRAELALLPSRQMLERFRAPYEAHVELGQKASVIADAARRLRCDRIVIGTARKNSLVRLIQSSTINKIIELTNVPVEIIAGDAVSTRWNATAFPPAWAWPWRRCSSLRPSDGRGTVTTEAERMQKPGVK